MNPGILGSGKERRSIPRPNSPLFQIHPNGTAPGFFLVHLNHPYPIRVQPGRRIVVDILETCLPGAVHRRSFADFYSLAESSGVHQSRFFEKIPDSPLKLRVFRLDLHLAVFAVELEVEPPGISRGVETPRDAGFRAFEKAIAVFNERDGLDFENSRFA